MVEIPPLIHVTGVEVIGEHDLRLTFEDGTVGDVGFGEDEWTGVFEPLRDPARFAKVQVEAGTQGWHHQHGMTLTSSWRPTRAWSPTAP
jgi:Protein of unknown function (DUF2442)